MQIVREAVLNAIKHAQAKHIEIRCHYGPKGESVISIQDDGVGIASLEEPDGHYGLTIMAERATRLGGELMIRAREPAGTEVSLVFQH